MTTSVDIIKSIRTKLDAWLVAAGVAALGEDNHTIGAMARNKHTRPPRIVWSDDDDVQGEIVPLRTTGNEARRWAEDVDRFKVQIWCVDTDDGRTARENCQGMAHNLIQATRKSLAGEPSYGVKTVRFKQYKKSADAQSKKGMQLTMEVEIWLVVDDTPYVTVGNPIFEAFGVLLPGEETPQDP